MLEIKDLKRGEIYKAVFKDHPNFNSLFVSTYLSLQNKPGLDGKRLYVNQLKYEHGNPGDWAIDTYTISFELPSLEELHWFKTCSEAGKFISKEEALKTFNKPKFESGKWYKDDSKNTDLYIKFDYQLKNDFIYSSERISKKIHKYIKGDPWVVNSRNWVLLQNISEIVQYLPQNHVDRLSYESQFKPKQEELSWIPKKGEWATIMDSSDIGYDPEQSNFHRGNKTFKIGYVNGRKWGNSSSFVCEESMDVGNGVFYGRVRKAKLEEIPVDKLTNDELLELAKEHYPIGTTFKGSYGYDCNKELPVTMHKANDCGIYSGNSYIYHKNHGWAKIVSQPEPKVQKFVEPFNAYYGDFKQEWTDYTQLEVLKVEEQNSNEINIPKVVKSVKRLDLNIEKPTFAEIKIPIQEKPRKVIKPIILEKFQLTI